MPKVKAPQLLETTAESFDQFIRQFQRYLRVEDVDDDSKLDLLLLCMGQKACSLYDELEWPKISDECETLLSYVFVCRCYMSFAIVQSLGFISCFLFFVHKFSCMR